VAVWLAADGGQATASAGSDQEKRCEKGDQRCAHYDAWLGASSGRPDQRQATLV